jgi:Arc/MetJ-type ribon-helix-helix transcriptional regulator
MVAVLNEASGKTQHPEALIDAVYKMYTRSNLTVVPVRLSDVEVRKLNMLLKRGAYRSRNEAIRAILAQGLEEKLGEDEDVTHLVNKLLAQKKNGRPVISFKSDRRVVEIVSEGRN